MSDLAPPTAFVERVFGYLDFLEDEQWWCAWLTSTPMPDFERYIGHMLLHGDTDTVSQTCLVIRDLMTLFARREAQWRGLSVEDVMTSHRAAWRRPLEGLLLQPSWLKRQTAVYTLAKVGLAESLPALRCYAREVLARYPCDLLQVVMEMRWLMGCGGRACDLESLALIGRALSSPEWLVRWAGVDVLVDLLGACGKTTTAQPGVPVAGKRALVWLRRACTDAHPWVRATARFEQDRLNAVARLRQARLAGDRATIRRARQQVRALKGQANSNPLFTRLHLMAMHEVPGDEEVTLSFLARLASEKENDLYLPEAGCQKR